MPQKSASRNTILPKTLKDLRTATDKLATVLDGEETTDQLKAEALFWQTEDPSTRYILSHKFNQAGSGWIGFENCPGLRTVFVKISKATAQHKFQFHRTDHSKLITEAAELSRLTEKVTNHFCFCNKRIFRERGISEQERQTFCTQLQEVRQVRNMAVHRVTPQSSTIRKYGKIVQAIVGFLPRIGGREFLQTYNDRIRQFIETFWDIEKRESGEVNASPITETMVIRGIESSPRNEQKEYNMKRSVEEQKLAAKIKANNISQMARDFHDSRRVKLMHVEQNQREKVDSDLRKKEKSERLIKQLADAQLRKDERAERNRKQQDEAQIRRAERAARNRQQMEKAQLKKAGQ